MDRKLLESMVNDTLKRGGTKQGALLLVLNKIQEEYGYLPYDVLNEVSQITGVPLSQIYGFATFYARFKLKERGKHIIHVCAGTACHVKGSKNIIESLKEILKVNVGDTTDDGAFTLEIARCFGACALAPIMKVDEDIYGNVSPSKSELNRILKKYGWKG